ncbi:MAG: glutathione S-transferase family protein [Pseudomonadota bacterium]|nr:glutathione S-transferase family protein [Pseudomonadota bacterium]
MVTLYNVPVSSYGAKVRIILAHKGIEWTELAPPDGYGSPAYRAIMPSGTVPAIIDGDLKLADSEAIAEYLDERVPTPPMMPAGPAARARAREISRFHDTRLEPVLRGYFGQVAPATRDADHIAANARLLQDRLGQLAVMAEPSPLMTGPELAIADCGFVASFAIISLLQDVLDLPVALPEPVAAYAAALAAHPSVAPEDARYRAVLADWADAKLQG